MVEWETSFHLKVKMCLVEAMHRPSDQSPANAGVQSGPGIAEESPEAANPSGDRYRLRHLAAVTIRAALLLPVPAPLAHALAVPITPAVSRRNIGIRQRNIGTRGGACHRRCAPDHDERHSSSHREHAKARQNSSHRFLLAPGSPIIGVIRSRSKVTAGIERSQQANIGLSSKQR
jgi:hypothetical protein